MYTQASRRLLWIVLTNVAVLAVPLEGTLYVQVDGGSENWNQVLFAIIDLLFDVYDNLQCLSSCPASRLDTPI